MRTIRIGNGQGFWGDNVDAPVELLRGGPIDYIGMDYLAEVTLSIMMRQKLKDPRLGYATDFIGFIRRVLPEIRERNVRILANAGGLNPRACRERIFEVARELGVRGVRVGVVEGDDLFPRLRDLVAAGHPLKNMDTGEPIAPILDRMMSANAYLGARPVVEALRRDALIVLCGRITDTALALAPMIHEFGWGAEDWDRLAAGTIAGHIIECGAQCTGGNFSRWWEVPDLWNVGYPIIEAREDGTFTVTKHAGTGGMVTVDTVSEQLLYEMSDPAGYITPDVVADFTTIRLRQEGKDRVEASGIQGRPRTPFLKISASYLAGFKTSGQITISGPRAVDKARLAAEVVWKRLERAGFAFDPEHRSEELLGTGVCLPGVFPAADEPPEVVLRLGVRDPEARRVERFGVEIAPLITAGPPGVTGFAGGRPKPQEVMAYWPALLAREEVEGRIEVTVEEVSGDRAFLRAWYGGLLAGLLPILVLGFVYSAVADRLAFLYWALAAAVCWVLLLRHGFQRGWPAARRAGVQALYAAAAFGAFAMLERRHHEILDLGFRAVFPSLYHPLATRPTAAAALAGGLGLFGLALVFLPLSRGEGSAGGRGGRGVRVPEAAS